MDLEFDLASVQTTEFGVGRDSDGDRTFSLIPVDANVQTALREMVDETWRAMLDSTSTPGKYDPSEKHGGVEYVYLPLDDDLVDSVRDLHQADNLDMHKSGVPDPAAIFCYFARLTGAKSQRLTALRRANQFKGVLKSRLVSLFTDTLRIIEDDVFKLDTEFDLLIDSANVHILRPSGFEFVAQLQAAVLAAAPRNIKMIKKDMTFVNFDVIEEYAASHPRAARYLASICSQQEMKDIDKSMLKRLCKRTGVKISDSGGKISVEKRDVMSFLEVLDRRRYEIELVTNAPEQYRAPSRQRLN